MVASQTALRNEILDRHFAPTHRIWVPAAAVVPCRILSRYLNRWPPVRGLPVKCAFRFGVILALASSAGAGAAQKLVDPNAVAPEFRAAAEKRRAEQIQLRDCSKQADQAKGLPRGQSR